VAAVAGDTLDALKGTEITGRTVRTMWGAIASQFGEDAWQRVADHDSSRSVPASDVWQSIFEQIPTLVIIDEVAAHIRALSSSGDLDLRRQAEAMPAFLFNLFTAAAGADTARVVITLATESDAFGEETTTVEKVLAQDTTAGSETTSVLARFREVLIPAKDEEISEIIRRRLFSDVDQAAGAEAGEAFADYYSELEKRDLRLDFPADFRDRMLRSYPLHPELINVLDRRVGTIPEFQRTRGALRLLAETVANLWESNTDASAINVADLPLAAGPVASALTQGIGREAFAQVLEADVAGPGSHADDLDRTRFVSAKPYATRAATTVFVHSLEHTASRGAPQVDVLKGTLSPGDDPDLIDEALRQLDQSAWHLVALSPRLGKEIFTSSQSP
jgi:predicted AAA+ superfamily ATPase